MHPLPGFQQFCDRLRTNLPGDSHGRGSFDTSARFVAGDPGARFGDSVTLWLKPLSVQGSGSGTPRKVVSARKTSGPKRIVGRPPWPSFSFASILSSSPPFRLVLD